MGKQSCGSEVKANGAEHSTDEGHYVPGNPLERLVERLDPKLRASGCAVSVNDPSETSEYIVTFPGSPPGRTPSKRRDPRVNTPRVSVDVEWGYELHTVLMSAEDWAAVKVGKELVAESEGWYEGSSFPIRWYFNSDPRGGLVTTYGEEGADGFIGPLSDAVVRDLPST